MCCRPVLIISISKNTPYLEFGVYCSHANPCTFQAYAHSPGKHAILFWFEIYINKLPFHLPLSLWSLSVLIHVAKQSSVIRIESFIYTLTQNVGLFPLSFSPITSGTLAGTFFSFFFKMSPIQMNSAVGNCPWHIQIWQSCPWAPPQHLSIAMQDNFM